MKAIEIRQGLQGYFTLVTHKADANGNAIPGTAKTVADFPNLITDNGKNLFAGGVDYSAFCQVGTGNTAPAVGNTTLASYVANTNTVTASLQGAQGAPPYYGWRRKTYRFAVGAAAGNLAEVGVSATNIGNLFSRALIVDGGGVPTTITVLADEILDVTYELRVYPILTDLAGAIVLEAINRATVLRAAIVTTALGNITGGWSPGTFGLGQSGKVVLVYGGVATLGAITAGPTVGPGGGYAEFISAFGGNRVTTLAYTNNTFYRDFRVDLGLADGNVAGSIGAIQFGLEESCAFQISFDPPLAKTSSKVLSLTFRVFWDRL